METTWERARGQWKTLLPQLGVEKGFLTGKNGPCPACGGKDRFRFTDRHGDGDYFCNQCGAGKGIKLVMKVNGWTFKAAASEVDKLLGYKHGKPVYMDKAHRVARAFFDSQPTLQEKRSKARLNILLDEAISFENAMKLLEILPHKVA